MPCWASLEQALTYPRDAGACRRAFASVEAITCFERALDVLTQLPPSQRLHEMAFDLHADLRNALVPLGRHQRLLEVLEAARRLAEELGDERRLAQVLSFLSNYYGNVGDSDLALETASAAGAVERAGPRPRARRHHDCGRNLPHAELPKAREFLRRAVALTAPTTIRSFVQLGCRGARAQPSLVPLADLGDFEDRPCPGGRGMASPTPRITLRALHASLVSAGAVRVGMRGGHHDLTPVSP